MNVLPLLERELLVRARNNSTYWSRLGVGVAGVVIGLPQLMAVTSRMATQSELGRTLFNGIVWAEFLLSCSACLLSADSISRERREGTLGLLFLTRIKSLDVLVGKFGSAALTALCGLLTLLPLLTVPFLAGGVTAGEALRMSITLVNTLFFSLAAGLAASVIHRERFKACASAVMLMALFHLLPLFIWAIGPAPISYLGLLSPVVSLILTRTAPGLYWVSLALVHAFGWMLFVLAAVTLRGIVGGNERGPAVGSSLKAASTSGQVRCHYCGRENATDSIHCNGCGTGIGAESIPSQGFGSTQRWNERTRDDQPIAWLLERRTDLKLMLLGAGLLGAAQFLFASVVFRRFVTRIPGSGIHPVWWTMAAQLPFLTMTLIAAAGLAWATTSFFAQARRTGELELLLTTPLGAATIVSDQWNGLRRLLLWPLMLMLFPTALWYLVAGVQNRWPRGHLFSVALLLIGKVLSVGAVCWLGLWFGFSSRGRAAAIFRASCVATIPPFAIAILLSNVSRYGAMGPWWLPQLLNLFFYVWVMRWAKGRLLQQLAQGAAM